MARSKKLSDPTDPEDLNLYDELGTQRQVQPRRRRRRRVEGRSPGTNWNFLLGSGNQRMTHEIKL